MLLKVRSHICYGNSLQRAKKLPESLWLFQGDIYILSTLDREKKDHYTLTAVAKDNPGDIPSNRRENSVQVTNHSSELGSGLGEGGS